MELIQEYESDGKMVRGNPQLKGPDAKEYLPEDDYQKRIQEIIKCKNDIVYFANNYFKIISPGKGLHQIKLYPKQEDMLRHMVNEDRAIILSVRQSGKTTCYTIFTLWYTIFNPEKKVMIAANKKDTSLEVLSRIQLGYEYIPNWLKPGITGWNKGEIIFSNLSVIKGVATSSDSARGSSANCITGENIITVRNKNTGIIEDITMFELYNRLSDNNLIKICLQKD